MSEIEKKEEWYLNIDYREAKEIIRNKLQGMTQNFIGSPNHIATAIRNGKRNAATDYNCNPSKSSRAITTRC